MRAIAEYADDPKTDDGDVFNTLMHTIIELLAHTSSFNRDVFCVRRWRGPLSNARCIKPSREVRHDRQTCRHRSSVR